MSDGAHRTQQASNKTRFFRIGADTFDVDRVVRYRTTAEAPPTVEVHLEGVAPIVFEGADAEAFRYLAERLFRLLDPVLPRDWRIVPPDRIAAALVEAAVAGAPGRHVVKSGRIGGG